MTHAPLDHLALRLPADAYYQLVHALRLALPPPPGLAQAPETTPEWTAKCRAQAIGMMRQANGALRLLLRLQQARAKREADDAGSDRAGWTEHCAISLMAEALGQAAAPRQPETPDVLSADPPAARSEKPDGLFEDPPPQPAPISEPAPAAGTQLASESRPEAGADPASLRPGATEAAHDAPICPERAAPIRAMGRLPDLVALDPPDDLVPVLANAGADHRLGARSEVSQIATMRR